MSALVEGSPEGFRQFVRAGSAAGMPAFPLDDKTLDQVQGHLQALAAAARRRGTRDIAIVGDASRGKVWFDGHCSGCHSETGDFKGIGARYNARILQGRIVLPRGNGVHPGLAALGLRIPGVTDEAPVKDLPTRVSVTQRGVSWQGDLVSVSDFEVSLRDAQGVYHSFARQGEKPSVRIMDPAQPHLDLLPTLSDQNLHDLTAYLSTLR
jgi:cytochrome c oxidase cbb3-type subunit 3